MIFKHSGSIFFKMVLIEHGQNHLKISKTEEWMLVNEFTNTTTISCSLHVAE